MLTPREQFAGTSRRALWQAAFSRRLLVTDSAIILLTVFGSQLFWFGFERVDVATHALAVEIGYWVVSVILVATWSTMLAAFGTRDPKIVGSGSLEYRRVADATVRLFGLLAIVAFLLTLTLARGYFLTALPIGLALILLSRWGWRQWLRRRQARGEYLTPALLVGDPEHTAPLQASLAEFTGSGLNVVGTFATVDRAIAALPTSAARTVILLGSETLDPTDMKHLGWVLDELDVELIVAPALLDVAGPRIQARPVAGLPLIRVDFPAFDGSRRVAKRLFDVIGVVVLIVLSSPLLVGVAIAVAVSSPGSIIYRQERIGRGGKPFTMYKFRSMVKGADDHLESLLDAQGALDRPFFKVRDDPRITRVGRVIRRHSLDEFPQLFNVLGGSMSLVGPRPQRAAEVALYDEFAHRRHAVKPGMSGLWQVSGRSRLDWEDSIRLDLYYVETWSITGDFVILWRTLREILRPDGAS